MFDKDNWQEISATIKKNKLRTALTSLGVGWGIFMLVIMLGTGNGLKHGVMKDFMGSATNSFFMWTRATTKAYKGMKPGRYFDFNNADVIALNQLKELAVVSPQNQLGGWRGGNNVVRGTKTGNYQVSGVYPNIKEVSEIKISSGRFLNENDIKEKRKVCVIGSRVREELFKIDENPLNEYLRINGVYFKIIGTTKASGGGFGAREEEQRIMLPFSTFQSTFNFGDAVGWIAVVAAPNVSATHAESKVLSIMKERHKIAPDDEMAIGHWNMETQFNKINGLFEGINMLIWVVGIGTLIAGVIGISNIMLIVVKERTKEIGIKRALGATPFSVVSQIIFESVFLTTLSGYFGLLSGIFLLEGLNKAMGPNVPMFQNPTVDLNVALTSLIILIICGALAGLIPASKAVAVSPVEALRAN
ncbi:MAG: ABC transporter permease [Bacteroidia bacterium]|nr:ABC transporter permease [Bacteroidia bacterium]MCZ2248932.1 ABC transporter permease [Bacteroidia bacterium]